MKRETKLTPRQDQQVTPTHETVSGSAPEFASAEEVLQYDAAQTVVPPNVAVKLQASLAESRVPKTSWWKKILGG